MDNTALDHLAQAHKGCTIAAYADLEIGIPLRTAAGIKVGQETLNSLCSRGAKVFSALAANADLAIDVSGAAVFVFVRAPDDRSSFLIAKLDLSVPLEDFIAQAKACVGATHDTKQP